FLSVYGCGAPPDLHSFPTRRSSDLDGFVGIERGVRLRHARNIRLGRSVYLDQGTYLHATPGGIDIGAETMVMHNTELHVFNFRRSEEHTSELQSLAYLVCRLLLEKK